MSIQEKYNSKAAALYRDKVNANKFIIQGSKLIFLSGAQVCFVFSYKLTTSFLGAQLKFLHSTQLKVLRKKSQNNSLVMGLFINELKTSIKIKL